MMIVSSLWQKLRTDGLLLFLILLTLILSFVAKESIETYPALVDWPTIFALAGLLLLTKAVEESGGLTHLAALVIHHLRSERAIALTLVSAAALLSTVLTNDVALFVLIPLTLSLSQLSKTPATPLIIFEALAVNVGSALTPIGNPQNLFLWQRFQIPFGEFIMTMLPLVVPLFFLLFLLTAVSFSGKTLDSRTDLASPYVDRSLLITALVLYLPFLILTDMRYAYAAFIGLASIFFVYRRRLLIKIDWALLLVFILMFIDLKLLSGLDVVNRTMLSLGLDHEPHLFLSGIALSQIISNVPATIALVPYSTNWQVIAYAVNIGGFGFMLGSLANLIALRMAKDKKIWLRFHYYSVPFLLVTAGLSYFILYGKG